MTFGPKYHFEWEFSNTSDIDFDKYFRFQDYRFHSDRKKLILESNYTEVRNNNLLKKKFVDRHSSGFMTQIEGIEFNLTEYDFRNLKYESQYTYYEQIQIDSENKK